MKGNHKEEDLSDLCKEHIRFLRIQNIAEHTTAFIIEKCQNFKDKYDIDDVITITANILANMAVSKTSKCLTNDPENELEEILDSTFKKIKLLAETELKIIMSFANDRKNDSSSAKANKPSEDNQNIQQLRQIIGDNFLRWAEDYFSIDGKHINKRILRKEVFNAFLKEYNLRPEQITAKNFGKRLEAFCRYKGLHLNAHKISRKYGSFELWKRKPIGQSFIGDRDATNGKEFITVSTPEYWQNNVK